MDVAALRLRVRGARDRLAGLADRIPILGRLLTEVARIEFIDRCMLIAAQGLLALVPMLIVVASFLPQITDGALDQLTAVTGLGDTGENTMHSQLDSDTVRAQTGIVGLAVTLFSATSFARAVQRMYERVWQQPHIGGIVGARRCFAWLLGWLMVLQVLAALRTVVGGESLAADLSRVGVRVAALTVIWWATSWLLLFGRVGWTRLLLGAALTGAVTVAYTQASGLVMPAYVAANARQLGTLGVMLSLSTWLIGLAAVLVACALVGRVVTEDPTVRRTARVVLGWLAGRGPRSPAGRPRRRPAGPA